LRFQNPVDFEIQSTYFVNIIALDELGNSQTKSLTINAEDGKLNIMFSLFSFFLSFPICICARVVLLF
jgi:hypothetical protein